SQMEAFLAEVEAEETLRIFPVGGNSFSYPTTLGFRNGDYAFSYTAEDFLWVNQRMGFVADETEIEDNTLFVTEREAKYLGLTDGGLFTENRDEALFYYGERPYRVRFAQGDNFYMCLIAEDSAFNSFYHLTWSDTGSREDFREKVLELEQRYDKLKIDRYEERVEKLENSFEINSVIFVSIIVVVTCVFFITINAVFVGIYDKRKPEFVIYESIGIPRRRIYKKIVGELLLITGIGMATGIALAFLAITLLNLFVYEKSGLQLYYYHPWSLTAWLVCNIMILLPSILLRLRGVAKSPELG
ncbi:MAG: FtsX-like permease family protein, partial [Lachnospiraceae bacterium]